MKENEWLLGMELLSLQRRKHKARLRCDLKPFSLCLLPFYKPNHTHIFFQYSREFSFSFFLGAIHSCGVWDMGRLWVCETRGGCGCVPNFKSENDHTMLEDILKEGDSIPNSNRNLLSSPMAMLKLWNKRNRTPWPHILLDYKQVCRLQCI